MRRLSRTRRSGASWRHRQPRRWVSSVQRGRLPGGRFERCYTVPWNWKKRLLVFDRIAFPNAGSFLRPAIERDDLATHGRDLLWLLERDLVYIPDIRPDISIAEIPAVQDTSDFLAAYEHLEYAARSYAAAMRSANGVNAVPIMSSWKGGDDNLT